MKKYLEKIDIWGNTPTMHVNRKKEISSWQAGVVCLIFVIISSIYTLIQLNYYSNLFYTEKYSQTNHIASPQINIKNFKDFMIAFCHGTGDNSTERDPIAHEAVFSTFEWNYYIRNPWLIEDKVFINLTDCSYHSFPEFIKDTNTMRLFNKCKCASHNLLKNFNLSFFFTDSFWSYFTYKLMFKDNIVNNSTLYKYYSDYFRNNSQRLFTYFIDSTGNVERNENQFSNYINYEYSYLSPDFNVVLDLFFSLLDVNLDDNMFFFCNFIHNFSSISIYRINIG
jgi:hypothetical protein